MSADGFGAIVDDPPLGGAVVADPPLSADFGEGQGIAGPPGSGVTYSFTFDGQSTWAIAHNLGRFPSVTTIETSGDQVIGDLAYLDANTLQVTFSVPVSGTAYLN